MAIPKFRLGDVLVLRKQHPCGENRWEVVRTGADIRLRCLGCGRYVLLPRPKVERAVKQIIPADAGEGQEP